MLCRYFLGQEGVQFEDHLASIRELAQEYEESTFDPGRAGETRGALFHYWHHASEPAWLDMAGKLTNQKLRKDLVGAAHRALILAEIDGHSLFLTFGHAHAIARRCKVERRFGRYVVGNAKGENELRGYSSQVYSGRGKHRTERRAHAGPNRELEIPRRLSNLQSIAAKIDDDDPIIVDGGVGVQYHAPVDHQSLVARGSRLLKWWNGGKLTDPWLAGFDRTEQERDKDVLELLDDELDKLVLAEGNVELSLSLDNDLLWQAEELYCQVDRKTDYRLNALDVESFRSALKYVAGKGLDIRRAKLLAKLPDSTTPYVDNTRDVISCELHDIVKGVVHLFEDGTWYRLATSWHADLKRITKEFRSESLEALGGLVLPAYTVDAKGEGEDGYIKSVIAEPGTHAVTEHH